MFLQVVLYLLLQDNILGGNRLDFDAVRLEILENFLVDQLFLLNFLGGLADFG